MKRFGLTRLVRVLVVVCLVGVLILSLAPGAIATPFSLPPTLIAQTSEIQASDLPRSASTPPSTQKVEIAPLERTTSEQRPTQDDQQPSSNDSKPSHEGNLSDRAAVQSPYDPYDMEAIKKFDDSWYGDRKDD